MKFVLCYIDISCRYIYRSLRIYHISVLDSKFYKIIIHIRHCYYLLDIWITILGTLLVVDYLY